MHVAFTVEPRDDGTWVVRRGYTSELGFPTYDAAFRAAQSMARDLVARGERVTLKARDALGQVEIRSFAPEPRQTTQVRSYPAPRAWSDPSRLVGPGRRAEAGRNAS